MVQLVRIYTDGANNSRSEEKHAAAAAVACTHRSLEPDPDLPPEQIVEWGRYLGCWTNNIAELCAVEMAVQMHGQYWPRSGLEIVTDSQYCQGLFTQRQDGRWVYTARKNRELVERIRRRLPAEWTVSWVRGHADNPYNERADLIAGRVKASRSDWFVTYTPHSGVPDVLPST